jgi:putative ABC transport system permease protein
MIRHVFKLVWNRKRSTGLVLIEILACFLVLCGILATAIHLTIEWGRPLGFDYENVWAVEISGMDYGSEGEQLAAERQALASLMRVVKGMPETEAVAISTNTPYSGSTSIVGTTVEGGAQIDALWTLTSEDLPRVLRMNLLYGRWVEETDGALGYEPVVLTRNLAREMFDTDNPVGRDIPVYDDEGRPKEPEDEAEIQRVVGVMDDYRRLGMMGETPFTMFHGVDLTNGEFMPSELLIRVRRGT